MSLTIGETVQQLHKSLQDYIEASYHVSHPTLVAQRQQILQTPGVIHQRPYLESTPRYKTGISFQDLGLDAAALDVFTAVSKAEDDLGLLIHDPPYEHQAISVKQTLVNGRSLAIMTGTGSGKTECFLLPILGKLASEAQRKGPIFGETPAVRAMVLYPMNALVNDQLGRLRLLFADPTDRREVHELGRKAGAIRTVYKQDAVSGSSRCSERSKQVGSNQRLLCA